MNTLNKITTAAVLSLGLAATAYASPMGTHTGHGAQQGGQHQGMHGHSGQHRMEGMKHDRVQGMNHGESHAGHGKAEGHGPRGAEGAQSLMTPEERQQMALANRAEMQKRATEKGITLPQHRGHRGRSDGPAAGEHKH
jgi:hypothetical protein